MLCRLDDVRADVGDRCLFEGVGATVEPRDRIALIGPNGAGKSTLLRILAGRLAASGGRVTRRSDLRVGYLSQDPEIDTRGTVWDVAYGAGGGEVARLERRLRDLERRVGDEPALLDAYGEALARFEAADGYAWEARVRSHLSGVGLAPAVFELPAQSLSGGQRMRLALACLLLDAPDLLLLDEPTNHLDLAAIRWLEEALGSLRGAVVFVSHDRAFLRAAAARVWAFGPLGFATFDGRYDAFRAYEARALAELEATRAARLAERDRLAAFVRKWSAGTRSRQAKDRERKLERIHVPHAPPARRSLRLRFGAPAGRRQRGLVLEGVAAAFGDRVLWQDLDLVLPQGARLGVVGANGSGKSTLLRILAGELAPVDGRVRWSDDTRVGWLRQDVEVEGESVLDALMRRTGMTRLEAHRRLAEALFTPAQMDTPTSALSGGERTRLALVGLAVQGANVLLLDEPTNHLDIDAQEGLEAALAAFTGTIVAVSHDRAFLAAATDRVLAFEPGAPPRVVGGVPDGTHATPSTATVAPVPTASGTAAKREATAARPARPTRPSMADARRLAEREEEIAALEARKTELETVFSGPYRADLAALHEEYDGVVGRLERAYAEWVRLAEGVAGQG